MDLIPIGQFARTTGLSIRALRLYDERNILRPVHINPGTGYRLYSRDQITVGERIRQLRNCDVPLETIRAILANPRSAPARLAEHRLTLKGKLEQTRDMLQALDALVKDPSWTE